MNGKTEEGDEDAYDVETPVEQHPGRDPQDEQNERRGGEKRHEMVSHRQPQDEHDQYQKVVISAFAEVLAPVEGQPR